MKKTWLVATLTLALVTATAPEALADVDAKYVDPLSNVLMLDNAEAQTVSNLNVDEVNISARSAAVIDVQTGRLLYEKNANNQMLIASLTKIATAITAIESGVNLDTVVTVSPRASGKEGSSIYLKVGEKHTIRDLLYAVMLRSGNDAATAVAEGVGKTEQNFVAMMNKKAEEIGLTQTHFANPHGLDAKGHYSSAHDLAVMTAYALRNPTFAEIVKTKVKSIPMPGETWDRKMYNKNKMLSRYEGADGVKTGYTKAAGRCLVSSATRNGRQVAVVTLDASSDWVDHENLLNFAFQKYQPIAVAQENATVKTVPVEDGVQQSVDLVVEHSFQYPVKEDERDKLRTEIKTEDKLEAPLTAGQKAGEMSIYYEDKLIGMVPIVVKQDVAEASFWTKLGRMFKGLVTR